jgi:hypothetical protein
MESWTWDGDRAVRQARPLLVERSGTQADQKQRRQISKGGWGQLFVHGLAGYIKQAKISTNIHVRMSLFRGVDYLLV